MYIVSYNLKRLFKWISDTTNRKWRDRRNGKNTGKIKMQMSCMDAIYDGVVVWGGGRGEEDSQGRFPSRISNFESLLIIYNLHLFPGKSL